MKENVEKIDWKKYSKEERKFLINLTLINRDYVRNGAIFIYGLSFSSSAFLISIYSLILSLVGVNTATIISGILILILLLLSWILIMKNFKKMIKVFVPSLTKQYQEIHKTLHPELFKEGGYFY